MRLIRRLLTKRISLKLVIFLTCVALIGICAGTVAIVTYRANSGLILTIARGSFERASTETIDNTEYLLEPVSAAIEAAARSLEDDATAIGSLTPPRSLYDVVDLYPQVYSAYLSSDTDGNFLQVQRIDAGARVWGPDQHALPLGSRYALRTVSGPQQDRVDTYRYVAGWSEVVGSAAPTRSAYDPRQRPFYVAAERTPGRVLTDIYTFASNGKPGVTIARRIERGGRLEGVLAADITLDRLSEFLAAQPVGQHGKALIVDADGRVVAMPRTPPPASGSHAVRVSDLNDPAIAAAWQLHRASDSPMLTVSTSSGDYLATFRHFPQSFGKDWIIMEVAPVDDFVGVLKATFRQITLFSLLILLLAGALSLFMSGQITKPIRGLTREADRIRSLVLESPFVSSSRIREIQQLIDSMAAMKTVLRTLAGGAPDEAAITHLLREADQRSPYAKLFKRVIEQVERRRAVETELALASAIQRSVLPRPDDRWRDVVQVSARMRPAREVGGDFYDWLWKDDRRLVFMVGDVSGKGIPAALFMTSTRTAIRTMIVAGSSLAEAVEGTNRLLCENNDSCFFVTLFIGEIDLTSGTLTYVNAGHEPARIIDPRGLVSPLFPGGLVLGIDEGAEFETRSVDIRPGDTIIALTDGVMDAMSPSGVMFGEERFLQAVAPKLNSADALVERIFTTVDHFVGEELQFDDITCIVLFYKPALALTSASLN